MTQPESEGGRRLGSAWARWRALAANEKVAFLVVNVGVNLVFLLRSYVTMRVLDYAALGLVTLMQSVMLLVGALQFGVINGGYRLLCSESDDGGQRINNVVYSFLGVVAAGCVAICAVALPFSASATVAAGLALGVLAGILTLTRTWVANQMIAKVLLRQLNLATLTSALASMLMLAFVPVAPLAACLAAIVVQPLLFVAQLLLKNPALRPTEFSLPRDLLRRVVASGFVVFLTSILIQVNNQLERWYVASHLGLDTLGHLYLTILFVNLFQLVPSSLDGLFLPRLVGAHITGRVDELRRDLRRFLGILVGYSCAAVLGLWLLAPLLIGELLPKYVPDLRYTYLVLPGLLLLTLSSPFAITFNVLIRYRSYLVAYGAGSAVTAAVFAVAIAGNRVMTLVQVTELRSAVYALMGAALWAGWLIVARSNPSFHFVRR